MTFNLRAGALALAIMAAASGTAWADAYQDGMTAFQGEDYGKALNLLLPYAKDGNAEAAYLIGEMYGPRSWGQKGENRNGVDCRSARRADAVFQFSRMNARLADHHGGTLDRLRGELERKIARQPRFYAAVRHRLNEEIHISGPAAADGRYRVHQFRLHGNDFANG